MKRFKHGLKFTTTQQADGMWVCEIVESHGLEAPLVGPVCNSSGYAMQLAFLAFLAADRMRCAVASEVVS